MMKFGNQLVRSLICTAAMLLPGLPGVAAGANAGNEIDRQRAELETRIAELIQRLGDENYATRERAQAELTRLGVAAFDALHKAQNHSDVEIQRRARYLIRSIRVEFVREDDPPAVKSALHNYEKSKLDDRRSRIDRLAKLADCQGTEALCRLARFEMELSLAKYAAISVMNQDPPEDAAARAKRSETIRATVGLSHRAAAKWLHLYIRMLDDAESTIAEWDRLIRQEQELLDLFPQRSDRRIVRELLQFQAELLHRLKRPEEATAVILRWVEFDDLSRMEILDAFEWLSQRKAWKLVDTLARRHDGVFAKDAELLYLLADAYLKQGNEKLADETADRAAALNADDIKEHVRLALELERRGSARWAQREYRRGIETGPAESLYYVWAHRNLAELFHDQQKELDAAKVLQDLIDRMEKDPAVLKSVHDYSRRLSDRSDPGHFYSRMYYFYALDYKSKGDRAKQAEHLEKAVEKDPTDVDVLIAMYRLPNQDEKWRDRTRSLIATAVEKFRKNIERWETARNQAQNNEDIVEYVNTKLASGYNQFAWLVGNTTGDYDEAIRYSKKSLELRPDAGGFYDTLAHCYFTKGDYENAVKAQLTAARLDPHSGVIRRQLAVFQKALDDSKQDK